MVDVNKVVPPPTNVFCSLILLFGTKYLQKSNRFQTDIKSFDSKQCGLSKF